MCPRSQRVWRWRERSIDAYGGGERDSDGARGDSPSAVAIACGPRRSSVDRATRRRGQRRSDHPDQSRTTMAFMARFTGSQVSSGLGRICCNSARRHTFTPAIATDVRHRRDSVTIAGRTWRGGVGSLSPATRSDALHVIGEQASRLATRSPFTMRGVSEVHGGEQRMVQAGTRCTAAGAMVGTGRGGRRTAATSPMPKPAATSAGS